MRTNRRLLTVTLATTAVVAVTSATAWVHAVSFANKYMTEAVNDYGGSGDLPNCIANADGFRTGMASGIPTGPNQTTFFYSAGQRWVNGDVWESDFTDASLISGGSDTLYFDQNQRAVSSGGSYIVNHPAIAMVSAHGTCSDKSTVACTSSASCTSPGAGQSLPGVCLRDTNTGPAGHCVYNKPRQIVTHRGGVNNYASYTTESAWGENTESGTFGGAGADGGVNFVLLNNSCAARPGLYYEETAGMFAGVTNVGLIAPATAGADSVNTSTRGSQFAGRYAANIYSSIAHSWAETSNGVSGGAACALGGGFHGISGCGAYVTISMDVNQTWTYWNLDTQNWLDAQEDNNDAVGRGYWSYVYVCNFDCATYPSVL